MKLYHGSTVVVKQPNIRIGRKNTDFGKGFYTTTDFDQAARWARIRSRRAGSEVAIVSVYEIDDNILQNKDFNISFIIAHCNSLGSILSNTKPKFLCNE